MVLPDVDISEFYGITIRKPLFYLTGFKSIFEDSIFCGHQINPGKNNNPIRLESQF